MPIALFSESPRARLLALPAEPHAIAWSGITGREPTPSQPRTLHQAIARFGNGQRRRRWPRAITQKGHSLTGYSRTARGERARGSMVVSPAQHRQPLFLKFFLL